MWFRRDLRDFDHAALYHALKDTRAVFCAFIFDREILDALPTRKHAKPPCNGTRSGNGRGHRTARGLHRIVRPEAVSAQTHATERGAKRLVIGVLVAVTARKAPGSGSLDVTANAKMRSVALRR